MKKVAAHNKSDKILTALKDQIFYKTVHIVPTTGSVYTKKIKHGCDTRKFRGRIWIVPETLQFCSHQCSWCNFWSKVKNFSKGNVLVPGSVINILLPWDGKKDE